MIKLKDLLNDAKTLEPNQDLKINGALVSMLKRAGWKVKSFKATKKGYNEIWSGEFKTKNAILTMSVNKYGDVFYQDTNIGRLDKSSKIIDWMKSIKRNNKWAESVNEEMDKYGNIHAKTKKELKAAMAKAINLILKGKTPKFDIINGRTGEMIGWKDSNDYVWQPNAIPYAERELK